MADLIDRQALDKDIEETVRFSTKEGVASAERRGADKVIYRIQAAATVDAVEVVLCKDCKHGAIVGVGYLWCKVWERIQTRGCDGYCCFGERREDDR